MARNMHKYEDLTPNEFDMEKEKASIIYLASGPLEYHEECNALGVDLLKGYSWCLKAAEKTGCHKNTHGDKQYATYCVYNRIMFFDK